MGITADFSQVSVANTEITSTETLATYKYVRGDTGPQLKLTFKTDDGALEDLRNASVNLHLRPAGGITVLTRPLFIAPERAQFGEAIVAWQEGDLDLAPGVYEGEIEVLRSNGTRESLYDLLVFHIRADFA